LPITTVACVLSAIVRIQSLVSKGFPFKLHSPS